MNCRSGTRNAVLCAFLCLGACTSAPIAEHPAAQPAAAAHTGARVEGVPPIPAELQARLRPYQNVRSAQTIGWIGDSLLITTRFGETNQLHQVDRPLGARTQLTFSNESVLGAWAPPKREPTGFIIAQDVGGSELYQLCWFDRTSGESRLLTDGVSRNDSVLWSHAGDRFGYVRTSVDGNRRDIMIASPDGSSRVAYTAGVGAWSIEAFSPDDQRVLLRQYLSINTAFLFELDLTTGVASQLLPDKKTIAIGDARYGSDANTIYFSADIGAEFVRLHRLDRRTGHLEVLTGSVPWDVDAFEISPDGRHLALNINEDGISRLSVLNLPDLSFVALPELPRGVASGPLFSLDGTRIALSIANAINPNDAYVVDLKTRRAERWTQSETGGVPKQSFIAPELIRYPTFDKVDGAPREVPAFVYRPAGPGPFPVVIYIHGGPESQFRPTFSATFQFLLHDLGVAVIAPNVRGSDGYGKSYLKLDDGMLREDSVADIGALLDWIATDPKLDAKRVAVMGGSYGGYMTLASVVHFGNRLAAGVESFGISRFVTFLQNTSGYRRDLRRVEYGDESDPAMREFLERISPFNQAAKITTPMLIMQGTNDPRVPPSESEQIVAALESTKTPVWYVLFDAEGHGFRRRVNTDYDSAATAMFLQQYLVGAKP
jgi:dipeptidyl aminopeptidase/acylaminoacyl peptidase